MFLAGMIDFVEEKPAVELGYISSNASSDFAG